MKLAAAEKHRLEERQRKVRKIREQQDRDYIPLYFDAEIEPHDGRIYYKYNHTYFERDRKN